MGFVLQNYLTWEDMDVKLLYMTQRYHEDDTSPIVDIKYTSAFGDKRKRRKRRKGSPRKTINPICPPIFSLYKIKILITGLLQKLGLGNC